MRGSFEYLAVSIQALCSLIERYLINYLISHELDTFSRNGIYSLRHMYLSIQFHSIILGVYINFERLEQGER